jgi:hypothetical protein
MKALALLTIAIALAAAPLAAQQTQGQGQGEKPAPTKEAKAAPTVAGKWSMNIHMEQGARQATLDIKLDGTKVAGTVASEAGETAIAGEYVDGKLVFSTTMQTSNGDLQIGFNGGLKDDGSLAGTLDYGQGAINWTAVRMKEK